MAVFEESLSIARREEKEEKNQQSSLHTAGILKKTQRIGQWINPGGKALLDV